MHPRLALTFAAALLAGCAHIDEMRELVREEPWRMYQTPLQRFTNIYDDGIRAGNRHLYLKDYEAALSSFQQAHDAADRLRLEREKTGARGGDPWYQMSTALRGMGNAHDGLRDFRQAEALYKRALELRESTGGSNNLAIANVLDDLGNNLRRQGRYGEALLVLEHAAGIYEERDLPHDYALVLGDIGKVHAGQGRVAEAEGYARRALETTEEAMRRPHRNPAALLNQRILHLRQYATAVRSSGRAAEADRLNLEAEALVRQQREHIASMHVRGERGDEIEWLERRLAEALSD